jgi:hypothetical protein
MGDPGPFPEIAVRLASSGAGLQVIYMPCYPLQPVKEITLYRTNDSAKTQDDEVLWRVSAAIPTRVTDFTAGIAPEGFTTDVPLAALPTRPGRLALDIQRAEQPGWLSFELQDLEEERFRVAGGKMLSMDEFKTSDTCDNL